MEGLRAGRMSTGSRSEATRVNPEMRERMNLAGTTSSVLDHHHHHHPPQKRSVKMLNNVQVVYYLTRNGQLEHPHYLEVSHLATQPLRLRDVIERLTILRGKAMPCQYSWSCKRSYKNGYVWNDLSENDVIYASEGSEYVLKGSELIQHRDFSDIKAQEFEIKGRKEAKGNQVKPKSNESSVVISTSVGHSFRQTENAGKHLQQNDNDDEQEVEEEDEEDKGSCNNSSNPPPLDEQCPLSMQMEQDESYSLPSTSSTNSDKPAPAPPPPPPKTPIATYSTLSKKVNVEKDVGSCSLTRNTVLLHLIACGGGSVGPKSKPKPINPKPNNNSFNFNSMRSTIMPCLKQQLSTRRGISMISDSTTNSSKNSSDRVPVHKDHCSCNCKAEDRREEEEEDEDMIMVKYMSENPRFGNPQSQEKEYFSGTIVETMATHHQHTPSSGSASSLSHLPTPVFTKSSSYNEQRSSKSGMQAAMEAKEEDKEREGVKVKGIIKCIPRRKSCGSNSSSKSSKI